jgi:hypothetical protein
MTDPKPKQAPTVSKITYGLSRKVSRKYGSVDVYIGGEMVLPEGVLAKDIDRHVALFRDEILKQMARDIAEEKAGLLAEGAADGENMAPPAPAGAPTDGPIVQPSLPGTGVGPGIRERTIDVKPDGTIKHTVTNNGNHRALVINKPFVQFGLDAWSEPLDEFPGFEDWRNWPIGETRSLAQYGVQRLVFLTKADGKTPDKIIRFE